MKRQKFRHRRFLHITRKQLLLAGLIVLALFVVGNAVLWVIYRQRTYPHSAAMGTSIGSIPYASLSEKTDQLQLPQSISLTHGDQKVQVTLAELGVRKDPSRTIQSADQQRSWLPVLNLFKHPVLLAPISIDRAVLNKKIEEIARNLRKDAVNARVTLSGTTAGIAEGQAGYELNTDKLEGLIAPTLDKGKTTIAVPVRTTAPKIQAATLEPERKKLQEQMALSIVYRYGDKNKRVGAADLAAWFTPSGETYAVMADKVQAYIDRVGQEFGIRVKDVAGVTNSTMQAVNSRKNLDLTLVRQVAAKTYLYCVNSKGVDAAHLSTFRSKLQGTLNDKRGWSLDGLVEFKEATSGCNFTAWLSAAELMPTFGGVCDAEWSCRSGPNVVINFTRWQNASPAWNAAGGALDEYRNMVINHETGHWLSFGHSHCSGAGQPAPVMQQQSINLEGCAFNAWPTSGELSMLRRQLGL